MHIATVSVNERLFEAPLGDDAQVLGELARAVRRLSVVVATRTPRRQAVIAPGAVLLPVAVRSRADGLVRLTRRLTALDAADPISLIHAQEPYYTGIAALLAARRTGSVFSVGVYGVDPDDASFRDVTVWHALAAPIGRRVLRRADRVQTDSTIIADRLAARGLPVRYKPMTPLGLLKFFEGGRQRVYRDVGAKVLWVGRLGRQKNLPLLLDAFAYARRRQPGASLVLVGDGPDQALVERRMDASDLRGAVTLLRALPQAELVDVYVDADVFLMSSCFEGMPRVLLEAAATGMPIVSTPVAGALELAQTAPVTIVEPRAEALGTALGELLLDREARASAGRSLRCAAEARLRGPPPPQLQLEIWHEALEG